MSEANKASALLEEIVQTAAELTGVPFWILALERPTASSAVATVSVQDQHGVTDRDRDRLQHAGEMTGFCDRGTTAVEAFNGVLVATTEAAK